MEIKQYSVTIVETEKYVVNVMADDPEKLPGFVAMKWLNGEIKLAPGARLSHNVQVVDVREKVWRPYGWWRW